MTDQTRRRDRHPLLSLGVLALLLVGGTVFLRDRWTIFHALVEVASVGVAWAVFLMIWNARRELDDSGLVLIGIGLLFAGSLDLLHTLGHENLNLILHWEAGQQTAHYWLAARLVEASALLAGARWLGRPSREDWLSPIIAAVGATTIVLVSTALVPDLITETRRPTAWMIGLELLVLAILFTATITLLRRWPGRSWPDGARRLLTFAVLPALGGEVLLSLVSGVLQGHAAEIFHLRFLARVAIYLALVELLLSRMAALAGDQALRRRRESIQAARLRISEAAFGRSTEEILRGVLDEAEALTGSLVGFFHFVDADQEHLELQTWSTRTLAEMCTAEGAGLHYPMAEAGVWADAVRTGAPVTHNDYASLPDRKGMPDGHAEIHCEIVVPVMRDGRVVAVLGVGNKDGEYGADDIEVVRELADLAWETVARKRAELARDESEQRLLRTMEHVPGMAYRCRNDEHWSMEFVSQGSENLTGYAPDDLIGNRLVAYNDLILPEDQEHVRDTVESGLGRRGHFEITYRIRRRDGEVRWVWEQGRGHFNGDRLIAIEGFIHDVTEQQESRLHRDRVERQALEAQKLESLGVLAGGIAHDFNNLLQTVIGNAQLAALDIPGESPAARSLEQISSAARRAADLTAQMLAYAGKGRFTTSVIDLSSQVRQQLELIESALPRTVEMRCDLAPDLPAIKVDAAQIQQVVMNLIVNAGEAADGPGGQVTLRTGECFLTADDLADNVPTMYPAGEKPPPGDYVMLEVSDNGQGIEPESLTRIFEPFFTTKFTGRGMGLAAVLGILRDHRGALLIDTAPGRGTTMRVFLPTTGVTSEAPAPATAPAEPPAQPVDLGRRTILVVDDENDVREAIIRMLTRHGASIMQARDGLEAIAAFELDPGAIDLVLLDLTMPRLDGQHCLQRLHEIDRQVRVVLMSGHSEQEAARQLGGASFSHLLTKPFDAAELLAAVAEAFAD